MEQYSKIYNANSLYRAFLLSSQESKWKESVQRYKANILLNIRKTQLALIKGTYKQKPFYEFTLNDRGKTRRIKSIHISDRVVQRSLCDEVLLPAVTPYLIYDNGASLKNKGIDFCRRRLEYHLHNYIRENGTEGHILKGDFSKFFDNIDHNKLINLLPKLTNDIKVVSLLTYLIKLFRIDVSNLSDEEIAKYDNAPINILTLVHSTKGEKYLDRSLGIGAQISQIFGIYYPTPIDNYVKIVRGCKYYGRYMDDFYIIYKDKQVLEDILEGIYKVANILGLYINRRKTVIIPLTHVFTFLQIKYIISDTGSIQKRISSKSFTKERRKLKTYSKICGIRLSRKEIANAYQSWKGNAIKYKANYSITQMDKLYDHLFVDN